MAGNLKYGVLKMSETDNDDCLKCVKCAEVCPEEPHVSSRGLEWLAFADSVMDHVENYTVPQYGDKGEDNVSEWSAEECFKQVEKYIKRRNSNQRPGQKRLDILKMAHYLCLADSKLDDNRHGLV